MSITDELRDWAHGFTEPYKRNEHQLLAIADRIDAEHERQCAESWMRGHDAWAAIDRSDEMAEHGWIRLPKDADGVPIRVGDKLDGYGKTITVTSMRYERFGWILISGEGGGFHDCSAFTHYHEPTVEDVLAEMLDAWGKLPGYATNEAIIAEYAPKLRLAGDEHER